MRGDSGGRGDKFGTITDPDVARSLKVLDLVIGEFDDGLESEIEKGDETQIKRNLKNKQNSAINDKIDHIFNELTQEIYVEQRRERRQKSPTRNVFDPLPAPPGLAKGAGRGREHVNAEGVRGNGDEGVKGRGKLRQEQERRGRQQHDRRKRADSCEDDRPPPGVVQAAKQSYLHKTKTPEARGSEVVLYNEGQEDRGASSEKVKVDVHNHAAAGGGSESSAGVKRTKSPGVARPSPPSQVPAVATKEKAVIKELREKVEGKQGKISKFSQRNASAIGKEEKRKDPLGSDSSSAVGQGRLGKPKRATSEAVRLESVAEEGRGQNRMRERRPEQRRGREERGQRSRSVGALEQERAREEEMEEQSRRLRRSKSRGSQDQLDEWEEVSDQQRRSRSRSKSISRSRGEILDVTGSSKRQEATVRPVEGTRGGGQMGGGQPFSRRQFLVQAANLQNLPPHPLPPAHHTGFLSPMRGGLPPRRHGSLLDLRAGEEVRRARHSYAAPIWEEYPPHLRGFMVDPRRGPLPPALDQQLRFEHQMNLEAHRDLLLRRGFPPSHPLVAGEIPIHPELMGHLHFEVPGNRTTLPLGQEDFARFLPEMQRRGMQSAFPVSTSDLLNFSEARAGKRKGGPKKEGPVVRREGRGKERSRSSDPRAPRPHSMFSPSSHRWVEGQHDDLVDLREKAKSKEEKPWFMKDIGDLQSLPHFTTRNDSGIGDDLGQRPKLNREGQARSSFGMILKDKFQKNPNMYFPDTKSKSPDSAGKEKKGEEWSDTDTLVHNMSEGSFDKDSGLSGGHSIVSSGSNVSGDSKGGTGSPSQHHSITTPKRPNNTAIALSSNPSVILNKKTLRNYTPRESGNMLRQFEETRQVTPGLEKVFNEEMPDQQKGGGGYKTSTATSRISDWSMVSSAASFDYHPGQEEDRAKLQDTWRAAGLPAVEEVEPRGERIPPEGATAPKAPKGATNSSAKPTDGKDREDKVPSMKNGDKSANGVVKDLMEASENDDELLMLRKLLSEGRIAGLNEKPPSFKPPSPPSKPTKPHPKKNKAPSPKPQRGRNRAEKSPVRGDKREAPQPPMDELKPPPPSDEVQFLSGRRIQSVENLHSGEGEVDGRGGGRRDASRGPVPPEAVRRSTSMHTQKEYENKASKSGNDDALAQLIADSTERKFKLNSLFKGIWKKKQYSFDLG